MTRTITITPVLNGFRVKVGCQEVVYTEAAALAHDFLAYVKDPDAFEKTVLSDALNRDLLKSIEPQGLNRLCDTITSISNGPPTCDDPTPQQERR